MRQLNRFFAMLSLVVLLVSAAYATPETIDLAEMNREELEALKTRIETEIKANHTVSSSEQSLVRNTTEAYVENIFKQQGLSVSWPWFDYTYAREWDFYTFDTHINYTLNGKRQENDVHSELYNTNGTYTLYYVQVGDTVYLDERASMPTRQTETAQVAATQAPQRSGGLLQLTQETTATPKATATPRATATPKPTSTPKPANSNLRFGETGHIGSFDVTMNTARRSNGSTWNSPDAGNEFVLVEFTVTNTASSTEYFNKTMNIEAYCDDYSLDYSFSAVIEETGNLGGDISAGKKSKGEYGMQVPKGWNEIEIHILESSFWSTKEIVFTVYASDIR